VTPPPSLPVDGLLLDMDGVLTVSGQPIAGAVEALARLRARGVPIRILTSTTGSSRGALAAGLRAAGFEIADDEVLTAARAAASYLRTHHAGARVALLGDGQVEDLEGVHLVDLRDAPDVVLLSGADESFAFAGLNSVYRLVLAGTPLVAMHRNLSWMTSEGVCLDAGAYLLGLERAAGRAAVVTGKPAAGFFAAGLTSLGLPAGRAAMVGDDVENDVLAAQRLGVTGVLVRTGKFRDDLVAAAAARPDLVVGSVADLPDLLGC
jgi:HAD superfamily hydrolase (TIGR01458 family)